VHFITRNVFLTPFVNLYIGDNNTLQPAHTQENELKKLPIKSVWIGPSRLEHLAHIGAYGHLVDHHYYGVEIIPSKLTERFPTK